MPATPEGRRSVPVSDRHLLESSPWPHPAPRHADRPGTPVKAWRSSRAGGFGRPPPHRPPERLRRRGRPPTADRRSRHHRCPLPCSSRSDVSAREVVYHLAGASDVGFVVHSSGDVPLQRRGHLERAVGRGGGRGRPGADRRFRGRLRKVAAEDLPIRGVAGDAPGESVRGRPRPRRTTWPSRRTWVSASRSCARPFNHLGRARATACHAAALAERAARNELDGRREPREGRQPEPSAGLSPTSATWCGPTGCSSSTASTARSYNVRAARRSPCRRWPTSSSPWPGSPWSW